MLQVLSGIGGIGMVILAQLFFYQVIATSLTTPLRLVIATTLMMSGAVLYGFATRHQSLGRTNQHQMIKQPNTNNWITQLRHPTKNWSLLCAGVCWLLSLAVFWATGNSLLVLSLWIVSIVATLSFDRSFRSKSIALRVSQLLQGKVPIQFLLLTGVLLLALILRTYQLTQLPWDFDGDFASHGLQARELAVDIPAQFFAQGWAGMPMLAFLPSALGLLLFGDSLYGLYLPTVLFGMLMLVGCYWLVQQLFSPRLALLATTFLSFSYVHIHFSRTVEYLEPVTWMVLALATLVKALNSSKTRYFLTSGIFAAFSCSMYFSGRAVLVLVGLVALYLLLTERKQLLKRWHQALSWLWGFLIGLGPYLIVLLSEWNTAMVRTNEVSIFSRSVQEYLFSIYQTNSFISILAHQFHKAFYMFHFLPDHTTHFGLSKPFLDPIMGVLLVLGMSFAIVRIKHFPYFLSLGWLALMWLTGAVFTLNAPAWMRLIALLPPIAILCALPLESISVSVQRWSQQHQQRWPTLILTVVTVVIVLSVAGVNWQTYVNAKGQGGTIRTYIARYLAQASDQATHWLVADPFFFQDREFEFLAPGTLAGDISQEMILVGSLPDTTFRSTIIILTPEHEYLLPALERQAPGGVLTTFPKHQSQDVAFYTYRIASKGAEML